MTRGEFSLPPSSASINAAISACDKAWVKAKQLSLTVVYIVLSTFMFAKNDDPS